MLNNLGMWLKGGVAKTPFEKECIRLCLNYLPEGIRQIGQRQISEYNLVQRETGNRTLNLYKTSIFNRVIEPTVKLPLKSDDCILVKLVIETGKQEKVNVVLHATNYRVFCVCFDKSVEHLAQTQNLKVIDYTCSWKSVI